MDNQSDIFVMFIVKYLLIMTLNYQHIKGRFTSICGTFKLNQHFSFIQIHLLADVIL